MMSRTMKIEKTVRLLTLAFVAATLLITDSACVHTSNSNEKDLARKTDPTTLNFEDVSPGTLPADWNVDATNTKGTLATWHVVKDTTAPSGENVLALITPGYTKGQTYNLCWTDRIVFLDGEIEVRLKAVSGDVDQGGGVVWRFQDVDNYYIARINPLENNFRIYYVSEGVRKIMADIEVPPLGRQWHTVRIVQHGNQFEGYLNGEKLLEGTDDLFAGPGGVGVWTKADAVTSFDDLSVRESR